MQEDGSLLQGIERELRGGGDEFFKVAEEGNAGGVQVQGSVLECTLHSVQCTVP